jgi:hypothetical protein
MLSDWASAAGVVPWGWPNHGLQRTGGQRRFAAQRPSQRSVVVLPPPLKPGALGARLKLHASGGEARAVDEISDCLSSHLLSNFKRSIAHVHLG